MSSENWHQMGMQEVSAKRQVSARARFEQRYAAALRHGDHLWIANVAYHITPPLTDGMILDADSIAMAPSVGCFICEQVWSERLAKRRCAGEPA